jgi:hypothetical protein
MNDTIHALFKPVGSGYRISQEVLVVSLSE